MRNQGRCCRRDAIESAHGRAEPDHIDDPAAQIDDDQLVANHAFRAVVLGFLSDEVQTVLTRPVDEVGQFGKLAAAHTPEDRPDAPRQPQRVDASCHDQPNRGISQARQIPQFLPSQLRGHDLFWIHRPGGESRVVRGGSRYEKLDGARHREHSQLHIDDRIGAKLRGLKLESRKGPVEYLVVDSAEKVPAGN